eukprot:scaffold273756_cov18-Tisochrysis_lutea.AAC.1
MADWEHAGWARGFLFPSLSLLFPPLPRTPGKCAQTTKQSLAAPGSMPGTKWSALLIPKIAEMERNTLW